MFFLLVFEGVRIVLFVRRVTSAITAGEIDDAHVVNEYVDGVCIFYSDVT